MAAEHFDVLIIGAGLSGIDAGWHLNHYAPKKTYVILENRERIGGTWDLFRYPGIRSDSDMLTMGYRFKPWTHDSAISPGSAIREYVTETARQDGVDRHIRFRHNVVSASWDSATARWTIEATRRDDAGHETPITYTANFLFSCAGYYRYSEGYTPQFAGRDQFKGTVIHPQHWPEGFNYDGKRVIIIGSGATAVTLLPNMAKTAAHVTMLQRTPTYYVSRPEKDWLANMLRADLICEWVTRLLNHMDEKGVQIATPVLTDPNMKADPWLDFSSGYVTRSISILPKQGPNPPWRQNQNYFADVKEMRRSSIDDGTLSFTKASADGVTGLKRAAE